MGGKVVPGASIEVGIEWCSLFEKHCCHSLRVAFLRIFQRFNCISYCEELVEKRLTGEMTVANKDAQERIMAILPGVEAVLIAHLCSNIFEGFCSIQFHDGVLVVVPLRWWDLSRRRTHVDSSTRDVQR